MSFIKRTGRRARRLSKMVDEMHPEKVYTIRVGAKAMTRTGKAWKAIRDKA